MSILVDENTKLVVQGVTGREGQFHTLRNKAYGTNVVAGVTPGKAGQDVDGIPVFNTVRDAVEATGANTSMIFVPPRFATDAIYESLDAGIDLTITITEGIPAHDMMRVYTHLKRSDQRLALCVAPKDGKRSAKGSERNEREGSHIAKVCAHRIELVLRDDALLNARLLERERVADNSTAL